MTPRELLSIILQNDVALHLHPLAALKAADARIHAGRDAVQAFLASQPDLFAGFNPYEEESVITVAGTNAAGLWLKLSLVDGLVGRIVLKRADSLKTRIRLVVAYDGTLFFGFQRQPVLRSVQAELELAVSRINDHPTTVNGCSRTDTGVHATGQVAHFDTVRTFDAARWKEILNHQLPEDVHVVKAETTYPLFHSRFDVASKEYRYTIDLGEDDPLRRNFAWFTGPLDVGILRRELAKLVGTHNFTSFCKGEKETKVRTILEARVEQDGDKVVVVFVGDGFLHNMIRLIVWALVRIAKGELDADMTALILSKSRVQTKDLAPAGGLCLVRITY